MFTGYLFGLLCTLALAACLAHSGRKSYQSPSMRDPMEAQR